MTTKIYAADRTALLIVDPYNDFMSEGGKLYEAIKPTADASGMFENLRKLIPAVRSAGIQVFIVPHHRSREGDFDGWQHMTPFQQQGVPLKAFEAGSWGGEFHPEFGPQKGDVVIHEHWAQSGFANTDLDAQLKQHGIEKIVLVGLVANSCIESTARYGMEKPRAVLKFPQEGVSVVTLKSPAHKKKPPCTRYDFWHFARSD